MVGESRLRDTQILEVVEKKALQDAWAKVSCHTGGGGLEQGIPNFDATKDAIKQLRKLGKVKEAKLLE